MKPQLAILCDASENSMSNPSGRKLFISTFGGNINECSSVESLSGSVLGKAVVGQPGEQPGHELVCGPVTASAGKARPRGSKEVENT